MNKQTKAFREVNTSTKVSKGTAFRITRNSNSGALGEGALSFQPFEPTKGRHVNSGKEREASGRKAWKGCGDPCNRKVRD